MSNSFSIDVAPQIATVLTAVNTVDTVVDLIRSVDVPNIQSNINVNETKLDTIITNIPQPVRGTLSDIWNTNSTTSFVDLINLSATQGKLYAIAVRITGSVTLATLSLTIDGITTNDLSITVLNTYFSVHYKLDDLIGRVLVADQTNTEKFNIDFADNLRLKTRLNTGAGSIEARMLYSVDTF